MSKNNSSVSKNASKNVLNRFLLNSGCAVPVRIAGGGAGVN